MKKYMPFNGLRWSRDSGSALYDIPQTAVFGRAGGANLVLLKTNIDNVILVSVGYNATLHHEERRVAA